MLCGGVGHHQSAISDRPSGQRSFRTQCALPDFYTRPLPVASMMRRRMLVRVSDSPGSTALAASAKYVAVSDLTTTYPETSRAYLSVRGLPIRVRRACLSHRDRSPANSARAPETSPCEPPLLAPTCRRNRVTGDDSPFLLLSITARLMARPPFHVEPTGRAAHEDTEQTSQRKERACAIASLTAYRPWCGDRSRRWRASRCWIWSRGAIREQC